MPNVEFQLLNSYSRWNEDQTPMFWVFVSTTVATVGGQVFAVWQCWTRRIAYHDDIEYVILNVKGGWNSSGLGTQLSAQFGPQKKPRGNWLRQYCWLLGCN